MEKEILPPVTLWVLLIGLNYYPKHAGGDLQGCVYDAECMKQYLETTITEALDMVVLTASKPSVHGNPPPENEEVWPTYDKVKSRLDDIIGKAKRGDRVYLYYSGHGVRDKAACGLPLLERDGRDEALFHLHLLYNRIDKMVKNGLFVTLALDCCFSGGIVRGDEYTNAKVRSLGYDTTIRSDPAQEPPATTLRGSTRDASMEIARLTKPEGYVVLAACAPDEMAFELQINGKKRGAFTHFLLLSLNVLRINHLAITHQAVHEHLRTSFHADWPQQTPMRYGKIDSALVGEFSACSQWHLRSDSQGSKRTKPSISKGRGGTWCVQR